VEKFAFLADVSRFWITNGIINGPSFVISTGNH
jgi:hypothetical protein